MTFSKALKLLKAGKLLARSGWNGKGMFILITPLNFNANLTLNSSMIEPTITMFTANQTYQPGWLPSQADLLVDDWEVVGG